MGMQPGPLREIDEAQGKLQMWVPCIQLTYLGNLCMQTLSCEFC